MSSCDSYSFFSPNSWICNGASAFTNGLGSGAIQGVEHQIEQAVNKLGDGIGKAAEQAFAKLENSASNINFEGLGTKTAKSINEFVNSFQADTKFSVDSGSIGKSLAENFKKLGSEFENNLGISGSNVGNRFGHELDGVFNGFWDKVNLKGNTLRFTNELNDAFTTGIKNANFAEKIKLAADEIGEGMKEFRTAGVREVDAFRSDIQEIFANVARDTTLKMIPWIALGGAILAGTPLLVMYIYKKTVYNIGRPRLALDTRKVGVWDRTTDGVSRTVSSVWNAAKIGVKWSVLTGVAGLTLATSGAITSSIMTGQSGYGGEIFQGLSCAMAGGKHYHPAEYSEHSEDYMTYSYKKAYYSSCDSNSFLALIALAVGAGMLRASASIASDFHEFIKKAMKKDDQPIFDAELQTRVDNLTTAVYNTYRNGGYMQNLLLYGPGGTGKTMIAKYIAKNSNMNYVMMSGGDLAQYIKRGEHVTELNKLFADAKNSHCPTIIFIDECESMCGDRDDMDRSELLELANAFLNHTGDPSKKIMIILATNRPISTKENSLDDKNKKKSLDKHILTRMDHKWHIGPPEQAERKKIIELYLPRFTTPLERKIFFTEEMITNIANQTEEFTGRMIFKMLNAISSMRATTKDNKLTGKMIIDTINIFVKQESEVAGRNSPSPLEMSSIPMPSELLLSKPVNIIGPSKFATRFKSIREGIGSRLKGINIEDRLKNVFIPVKHSGMNLYRRIRAGL